MKPLGNPFRKDRNVSDSRELMTTMAWHLAHAEEQSARAAAARSRKVLTFLLVLAIIVVLACQKCSAAPIVIDMTKNPEGAQAAAWMYPTPYPLIWVHPVMGTGSMIPLLDEGCFVMYVKKPWKDIEVHDVISYQCESKGFTQKFGATHEVVYKFPDGKAVICKGLNNQYQDPNYVHENEYQGCVYLVVRFKVIAYHHSMDVPTLNHKLAREAKEAQAAHK